MDFVLKSIELLEFVVECDFMSCSLFLGILPKIQPYILPVVFDRYILYIFILLSVFVFNQNVPNSVSA